MGEARKVEAIGFPSPLMGETPLRLPILARGDEWIALEKPAGVAVRQHPWQGALPDLDATLNQQLRSNKPELVALGASVFGSIYYIDEVYSGPVVFGTSHEGIAHWRNSFGSSDWAFEFLLIAQFSGEFAERRTDAPLLPHRTKPKMIPSTAKGKKSQTCFSPVAQGSTGWSVWRALTSYPRPHQIRAHAALLGLNILGDSLYNETEVPSLGSFKRGRRDTGLNKPAFRGVGLHLSSVEIAGVAGRVESKVPRNWRSFLKLKGIELAAFEA